MVFAAVAGHHMWVDGAGTPLITVLLTVRHRTALSRAQMSINTDGVNVIAQLSHFFKDHMIRANIGQLGCSHGLATFLPRLAGRHPRHTERLGWGAVVPV